MAKAKKAELFAIFWYFLKVGSRKSPYFSGINIKISISLEIIKGMLQDIKHIILNIILTVISRAYYCMVVFSRIWIVTLMPKQSIFSKINFTCNPKKCITSFWTIKWLLHLWIIFGHIRGMTDLSNLHSYKQTFIYIWHSCKIYLLYAHVYILYPPTHTLPTRL